MKKINVVIMILLTSTAYTQTLDLEQARLLALANSRSLARYELAIRSSVLDERSQLYTMLPQIDASYSASVNYFRNWEFVNPADTFTSGVNLSITQILFQGGKSFVQKAIANISTESTRKDALAEYFNVLDSVDNAYYAVLEAAATLEAESSSLQAAQLSFSIAEVRQSTGMINAGDYLKAMADKEARENSYNQARRNLTLNEARLRSLTGITGAITLEQIDMSSYEQSLTRLSVITDEEAGFLYDEFWKILAESNPSLAKAVLNSERAERNLSIARRDYAPTISATIFSTGFGYSAAGGFSSTSSGGVTIRGSIPLDFWVLNNRLEKSAIARDSAALDYINAHSSLENDLQSALLNIFAQAGSVLSSRRSLEYTERHYEFVMERYRLSLSSVSELTDASSLYITSRNSHIRSTYSFLQSLSRLRSLCALDDEGRLLGLLLHRLSTPMTQTPD